MATIESPPADRKAPVRPIACIELDRFCEDCGYNLRTLPVHRDEHTGIPVVRCTECGRYQPANDGATVLRPWLHRVTSVLLLVWILTIATIFIHLGVLEGMTSYVTLDELTQREGAVVQRINNTTIRTWGGSGPLEVKSDYPEYNLFVTVILSSSFLLAFACGLLAVVVFPHWRRAAYAGLMLVMPVVVGGIIATVWRHEAPHLFTWGLHYVMIHAAVQVLGGLAGITFGRPLARLAVRVVFPPSVRPRLAFLWLADNKPFPHP